MKNKVLFILLFFSTLIFPMNKGETQDSIKLHLGVVLAMLCDIRIPHGMTREGEVICQLFRNVTLPLPFDDIKDYYIPVCRMHFEKKFPGITKAAHRASTAKIYGGSSPDVFEKFVKDVAYTFFHIPRTNWNDAKYYVMIPKNCCEFKKEIL